MECTHCGALVPPGRKACPTCGMSVARNEKAASASGIEGLLAEANLARTRGQYDDAISACRRVLGQDATNAAAHSLIANIYRDQGNYREALGWFKLAVELNPDNEADRKKLDEMIDHVFRGAMAGQGPSRPAKASPAAAPHTAPTPARRSTALRTFLSRLQPIHVVIGTTVLAFLVLGTFVWITAGKQRASAPPATAHPTETAPNLAAPGGAANADASSLVVSVTPPLTSPPPPDAVEGGARAIPGLPGIIVQPGRPNSAAPTTPAARPETPSTPATTPESTAQVPPFQPLTGNTASGASEIELQTTLLQMSLDTMLQKSKLPAKLEAITIDPRTNALTLRYAIPHMAGATETKQGLLYTGFNLIWAAAEQNKSITTFTLRGYAHVASEREPSLALVADVTPQQAANAHTMTDYRSVATFLSDPWWRPDLRNAAL